jgi:hypothetical protein
MIIECLAFDAVVARGLDPRVDPRSKSWDDYGDVAA